MDVVMIPTMGGKTERFWSSCRFNVKYGNFAKLDAIVLNQKQLNFDVKVEYSIKNCEKEAALSRKIVLTTDLGMRHEASLSGTSGSVSFAGILGNATLSYEKDASSPKFVEESCMILIEKAVQLPTDSTVTTWKLLADSLQSRIQDNYNNWLIAGPLANLANRSVKELIALQNGGVDQDGNTIDGKLDAIVEDTYFLLLQMNLIETLGFPGDLTSKGLESHLVADSLVEIPTINGTQKVPYTQLRKTDSLPSWFMELINHTILDDPQVSNLPTQEIEAIEREIIKLQLKIADFDAIDSVISGAVDPDSFPSQDPGTIEKILIQSQKDGETFLQFVEKYSDRMRDEYSALLSKVQLVSQRHERD